MRRPEALWRWGPAAAQMAVIYLASNTPSRDLPDFGLWQEVVANLGHAVGYALLALALARGWWWGRPWDRAGAGGVLALALAYAVSDELHQAFVPGRSATLADVIVDAVGALSALAALGGVAQRAPQAWRWLFWPRRAAAS